MPRRRTDSDAKIALPITPMLDMTFQLLFFFIMNFNPADLEGQMDMSLPSESPTADKKPPDKPVPVDQTPEPEFKADLTIQVRTRRGEDSTGSINGIFVRGLDGKEDSVKDIDGLRQYLKDKQATLTNKDSLKIRGDNHLRIKYLMKVMDACKAEGFTNTSLIPPEDLGR